MLEAYPLDDTRSTYVHTDVNKVVAQFVTNMLLYYKLPSTYKSVDAEVISFLLTKEGMNYKMSRLPRKMRY
jgi:hypothetical protein